jgi:hypothetical protein
MPRGYAHRQGCALLRGYLQARCEHRPIEPGRFPGMAARAIRSGANPTLDRGGPPDLGRLPGRAGRLPSPNGRVKAEQAPQGPGP